MSTSYTLNNPSYTYGNLTASGTAGTGLTYANDAWVTTATNATWNNPSPTLQLNGEDADIVINGQSLNETLQAIQEELAIPGRLNRNLELEQDFEELKQAADHYNTLLNKYKEQKKVFDILKKQDQ